MNQFSRSYNDAMRSYRVRNLGLGIGSGNLFLLWKVQARGCATWPYLAQGWLVGFVLDEISLEPGEEGINTEQISLCPFVFLYCVFDTEPQGSISFRLRRGSLLLASVPYMMSGG